MSKTPKHTKKKKRSAGGRGILWFIAIALVGSAALRIGGHSGPAIAREISGNDGQVTSAEPESCEQDADISAVLNLLQDREARVTAREDVLLDREQALAVAEAQVRKNLDALAAAEADLERMIAVSSAAAEDDLSQLTSVYENMKPKQAALVFSAMDPEFAAGFLSRMRTDAAAQIMAGLDPETAYAISVLLAGRNASAPTE